MQPSRGPGGRQEGGGLERPGLSAAPPAAPPAAAAREAPAAQILLRWSRCVVGGGCPRPGRPPAAAPGARLLALAEARALRAAAPGAAPRLESLALGRGAGALGAGAPAAGHSWVWDSSASLLAAAHALGAPKQLQYLVDERWRGARAARPPPGAELGTLRRRSVHAALQAQQELSLQTHASRPLRAVTGAEAVHGPGSQVPRPQEGYWITGGWRRPERVPLTTLFACGTIGKGSALESRTQGGL